ncbi:MAG: MoxR family ATPase [Anaerolineales bacterium]|nr:MoxR family ATPase [Anaerolineales bacterium]
MTMEQVQSIAEQIIANIEKVIIGKREAVELTVVGLLTQGHLLIEDVPGVGKTMLARTLARSLGCSFNRLQFTPDMLPSDVTGVSIFNQISREFEFRPGPIMAQIVLADEINRATPKTQSALLEAMQERTITVDGQTHNLPQPFMVLATQNPIEYEGTFPLPEAQLDRFLLRVRLGYLRREDEIAVLTSQQSTHPLETLASVISQAQVVQAQALVSQVYVAEGIKRYIVDLARQTRDHPDVYLGVSTRGSLALFHASQARAAVHGRSFVIPDDVKALARAVLAHRLILGPAARLQDISQEKVIDELVAGLPVPGGEWQLEAGG